MRRHLIFGYGLVAYGFFLAAFLYAIGFLTVGLVPKSIDTGPAVPLWEAILVNSLLLGAFAVQHTIMARPAFKRWWTQIIPPAMERSTFVLAASLLLLLLFWQWRPIPGMLWQVEHPVGWTLLTGISLLGWATVLYTSFLIDHFDLFGLRQVFLNWRGQPYTHPRFIERSLYRVIRHPLMAGFLVAFWFTPTMTYGHLLFAGLTTAYIFIGVAFEERDLVRALGPQYLDYRARTPMLCPYSVLTRWFHPGNAEPSGGAEQQSLLLGDGELLRETDQQPVLLDGGGAAQGDGSAIHPTG